ncbi:Pentatricopeptide repeat-containing protein [Cinnamomum micranthum f. kanehirae]|uniref:Pentatricopeptide repeat-containing protein n=1 Tax=Cinnamomum micranthum f. kanehirae TaxID=337451 RepID=A0A3S3N7W4_9MAGN|nr:Pentatricopeptide repeat-containing protein [Cinnamomum micranthum f. kanehirae]
MKQLLASIVTPVRPSLPRHAGQRRCIAGEENEGGCVFQEIRPNSDSQTGDPDSNGRYAKSYKYCRLGWAQPCTLSNVSISQSKTGQIISGKPEFEVTISNNCICTQTNVKVQCTGFSSVEQVDPAVFSKTDDQFCLVNMPITQSSPVSFKYASDVMYNLTPVDSNVSCS